VQSEAPLSRNGGGFNFGVLQALPGIGPKRAKALLDRFGSVKAVLNASSEALAGVPGMGLTVIHRVQWATGEERLEGR
jgi:DNA excision repair protein ERCC-4